MTVATCVAPPEFKIGNLDGTDYKLRDWLTSYPLMLVAIDPYTAQSSWILDTAVRIFRHFRPADIRVGWICVGDAAAAKQFLGPLADEFLTIADPDAEFCNELGLKTLPSLVHIRVDGFTQHVDGWDPEEWAKVTDWIATIAAWSKLNLGVGPDPVAYPGTTLAVK